MLHFLPIFSLFLIIFSPLASLSQQTEGKLEKLCKAYPYHIVGCQNNEIIWKDGTKMTFDDGKIKDFQALLDSPDLEDQMKTPYPKGESYALPKKGEDAGRVRCEPFFRKMYGNSSEEVSKKLTTIVWLPKTLNIKLRVTTVNNIHKKMEAIAAELDEKPHLRAYLEKPAGTFNWRNIKGTSRLSTHSFGMTIDLNVAYSNYWQWDSKTTQENADLGYKNKIPLEIVTIFEKHGFIWGGKWYHYDTMHFEYRPELL
jgi:peptidoglycan LD-endopeptidase CwlK